MSDCCNNNNSLFDCNCFIWVILAIIIVLLLTNNNCGYSNNCGCNNCGC
ncbi:MAG: hypothetical protein II359_00345 [Clostridia bacterium]|nr:hypothetical protein [Clostridia bacterium]